MLAVTDGSGLTGMPGTPMPAQQTAGYFESPSAAQSRPQQVPQIIPVSIYIVKKFLHHRFDFNPSELPVALVPSLFLMNIYLPDFADFADFACFLVRRAVYGYVFSSVSN